MRYESKVRWVLRILMKSQAANRPWNQNCVVYFSSHKLRIRQMYRRKKSSAVFRLEENFVRDTTERYTLRQVQLYKVRPSKWVEGAKQRRFSLLTPNTIKQNSLHRNRRLRLTVVIDSLSNFSPSLAKDSTRFGRT